MRAVSVVPMVLSLACQPADRTQQFSGGKHTEAAASAEQTQSDSQLSGLYVGTSASRHGWLLRLDFDSGVGVSYSPTGIEALCQVQMTPSGAVSLVSATSVGVQFRFRGNRIADEIVGQLQWIRVETGAVAESSEMRIRWIASRLDTTAAEPMLEGMYSSIEYHERSGDLGGLELALVPDNDSIVAIVWDYQDGLQRPYAPVGALVRGDTIRLNIRGVAYLFLRSADTLSYLGSLLGEPHTVKLPRRSSVWEALQKKPRYSCS